MKEHSINSPKQRRRIFASGAIGNMLETYDLILISFMATSLGTAFFPPAANSNTNILNILYVYLLSVLVRPVGNIVLGIFADTLGRKKIMIFSLVFTGIGTIGIGVLPSYSLIGTWSTALFIIFRLCQNFFTGIEYVNSATYLIECSGEKTRGYYASWTAIGICGGYLLASFISLGIFTLISHNILPGWSWRFVFLFSIFGVIYGFWIRKTIPESLTFILNHANTEKNNNLDVLSNSLRYIIQHPIQCLSISAITLLGVLLGDIYYIYIPINLMTARHFTDIQVYGLNSIGLAIIVMLIPFFGKISDYLNRIALLKFTCVIVLALVFPFFWLCSHGSYIEIILITAIISVPASCFFSLYPALITEYFPSRTRCTIASIIYQISVTIMISILPLLTIFLINNTGLKFSFGYLLIAATLIAYTGLTYLKKYDSIFSFSNNPELQTEIG